MGAVIHVAKGVAVAPLRRTALLHMGAVLFWFCRSGSMNESQPDQPCPRDISSESALAGSRSLLAGHQKPVPDSLIEAV
jgi:hypothetical protein